MSSPLDDEDRYLLKPAAGRVAIKIKDVDRMTKSGLVLLSDNHAPAPTVGEVVATCDSYNQEGEEYDAMYQEGDVVIFGKYVGTKVKIDRETYILLRENDILARLIPSDDPTAVHRGKVKVRDND